MEDNNMKAFTCRCGRKYSRPTCPVCIEAIKTADRNSLWLSGQIIKETEQPKILDRLNPENLVIWKQAREVA
jgi:hypothetical protein